MAPITLTKPVLFSVILILSCFHVEDAAAEENLSGYKDATAIVKSLAPGYKTAYQQKETRSIDLDIKFKINSANLAQKSIRQLNALGKALLDKRFSNTAIIIAGHTDASGSSVFNKQLSRNRAKAVSYYLQKNFKISSENLSIIGFGETRLKNILQPNASINRRVEIMVEDRATAQQKSGKLKW